MPVPAGAQLGDLIGGKTVLAHHVRISMAIGAHLDRLQLAQGSAEVTAVCLGNLERVRVSSVTVVAANVSVRVHSEQICPPLVRVTDQAAVLRVDPAGLLRDGLARRGMDADR
jgi:hypothetical protein